MSPCRGGETDAGEAQQLLGQHAAGLEAFGQLDSDGFGNGEAEVVRARHHRGFRDRLVLDKQSRTHCHMQL